MAASDPALLRDIVLPQQSYPSTRVFVEKALAGEVPPGHLGIIFPTHGKVSQLTQFFWVTPSPPAPSSAKRTRASEVKEDEDDPMTGKEKNAAVVPPRSHYVALATSDVARLHINYFTTLLSTRSSRLRKKFAGLLGVRGAVTAADRVRALADVVLEYHQLLKSIFVLNNYGPGAPEAKETHQDTIYKICLPEVHYRLTRHFFPDVDDNGISVACEHRAVGAFNLVPGSDVWAAVREGMVSPLFVGGGGDPSSAMRPAVFHPAGAGASLRPLARPSKFTTTHGKGKAVVRDGGGEGDYNAQFHSRKAWDDFGEEE